MSEKRRKPPAESRYQRRKAPRQQRALARVESILDATRRILRESGAGAVSTSRIAREAGVPVGSVYQYFPNKEAVLLVLYEEFLAGVRAVRAEFDTPGMRALDWREFFTRMIRRLKQVELFDTTEPELLKGILQHPELQLIEQRHVDAMVGYFADNMQRLGARGPRARLERLAHFSYLLNEGVWQHQAAAASSRERNESIEWEIRAVISALETVFPEQTSGTRRRTPRRAG